LRLPLPRQSILISVCHVLLDLHGFHNVFLGNSFSSIRRIRIMMTIITVYLTQFVIRKVK
jgi:hypothetical protein